MKLSVTRDSVEEFAREHLCTITKFAQECGVSRQTIYELNTREARPDTIRKILIGMSKIRSEHSKFIKATA